MKREEAILRKLNMTDSDFNLCDSKFEEADKDGKLAVLTLGDPRMGQDECNTFDVQMLMIYTRIKFPIVGQAELHECGLACTGDFNYNFRELQSGEEVHVKPMEIKSKAHEACIYGRKMYMFRSLLKAIATRQYEQGVKEKTVYHIDATRLAEIAFTRPTQQQIDDVPTVKDTNLIAGTTIEDKDGNQYELIEVIGNSVWARALKPVEGQDDIFMIHKSNIAIPEP